MNDTGYRSRRRKERDVSETKQGMSECDPSCYHMFQMSWWRYYARRGPRVGTRCQCGAKVVVATGGYGGSTAWYLAPNDFHVGPTPDPGEGGSDE